MMDIRIKEISNGYAIMKLNKNGKWKVVAYLGYYREIARWLEKNENRTN